MVRPINALPKGLPAALTGQRLAIYKALFVAFLLLVLIGPTPFEELVMRSGENQGDILRQVGISAIFLGVAAISFSGGGRLSPAVPATLVLTLCWSLLSVGWAVDPLISVRRLALTVMVAWIVCRSVIDLGADRALHLLKYTLVFLLVVNFLVVIGTDYGVHPAAFAEDESVIGDWRGILPHKNLAGATCAVTVILFLFQPSPAPRWLTFTVVPASLLFLAMTESKTSQGVLVLAVGAGIAAARFNPRHRSVLAIAALVLAAALAQLAFLYSGVLEQTLNDPGALTGRTQIWPLLVEYIAAHPIGGSGYGSFWQIGPHSPIWQLTGGWVAQYASHGHNGFLDLAVTIGIPGLVLAVISLVLWPAARLMMSLSITPRARGLLLALLAFCAGHNMTESSLLDRAAIVEVFLLIAVAMIYDLSRQSEGEHNRLQQRFLRTVRLTGSRRFPVFVR